MFYPLMVTFNDTDTITKYVNDWTVTQGKNTMLLLSFHHYL